MVCCVRAPQPVGLVARVDLGGGRPLHAGKRVTLVVATVGSSRRALAWCLLPRRMVSRVSRMTPAFFFVTAQGR